MTRLADALRELGLAGEIALEGRWVKLRGEWRTVYVAQAAWGSGYYTLRRVTSRSPQDDIDDLEAR